MKDAVGNIISKCNFVAADCGAANGLQTHWAPIQDYAELLLFEPHRESYVKLKELSINLGLSNQWHIFQKAVSDKSGSRDLYLFNVPTGSSLLPPDANIISKDDQYVYPLTKEKVDTIRLDEACAEIGCDYIDLIKIDVQGTELDVLNGLGKHGLNNVIAVEVENIIRPYYMGQTKLNDLYQLMERHGLQLFDLKSCKLKLNDYKHKDIIKQIMGVKYESLGFANPIHEFDLLFFRSPDNIINSKDHTMLRKLVLCLCLYGFYPSAVEITERAREENILTDSESDIINNSIRTIYEKKYKQILDHCPLFKRIIFRVLNKLIHVYDKRTGWNKMTPRFPI